ncbi:protein-export chaperone SecB [Maridesulfovibrio sp.]|uniref:protein-export chaperone SecB n=1 Tax=Maridesulfovibrio sp. TaxID=2795000 RepID=UPI0039F0DB59
MGNGSIKSGFQFKAYKIDTFNFELAPHLNLLALQEIDPDLWKISIGIRQTSFHNTDDVYLGGLDLRLHMYEDEQNKISSDSTPIISLEAGIAGIFQVEDRLEEKLEKNLAKLQIPSILLPYLRSSITSFLANAGFGCALLPLINIYELSKKEDYEIQIVD